MKKINKISNFALAFISGLLFSVQNVIAAFCGGAQTCSCGDYVQQSHTMTYDLNCPSTALVVLPGVSLNCANHILSGDESGSGILFDMNETFLTTTVTNCKINNFYTGIGFGNNAF